MAAIDKHQKPGKELEVLFFGRAARREMAGMVLPGLYLPTRKHAHFSTNKTIYPGAQQRHSPTSEVLFNSRLLISL